MLKFSKVHDVDGDPAVKEILVFSSVMLAVTHTSPVYKLRAVLNGNGTWSPIIRCGVTGTLLFANLAVGSAAEALKQAKNMLKELIMEETDW
jgi:hypothetical protein